MIHEGDAAHLHVTTNTQINLHKTHKNTYDGEEIP